MRQFLAILEDEPVVRCWILQDASVHARAESKERQRAVVRTAIRVRPVPSKRASWTPFLPKQPYNSFGPVRSGTNLN